MNKIPTISIDIDPNEEISLFLSFLNHTEFPQHRFSIFKTYPQLETKILSGGKEKEIIEKFIYDFYSKNKKEIENIITESKKELQEGNLVLKQLEQLMEYEWKENQKYKAYPTILPFSPFKENSFYFSILNQLNTRRKNNILYVATHEISHFIFFDLLKKVEKKYKITLGADAKYYLKEGLTTVILNTRPLKQILDTEKILGNPDIRDIYIKEIDKEITLIDYIKKEYKNNKGDFMEFLSKIILTFNSLSDDFSKKRKFWNKNGKEIFSNTQLMKKYKKPIVIKKGSV